MSELRWILLIAGILVLAWVIWQSRREFERREREMRQQAGDGHWEDTDHDHHHDIGDDPLLNTGADTNFERREPTLGTLGTEQEDEAVTVVNAGNVSTDMPNAEEGEIDTAPVSPTDTKQTPEKIVSLFIKPKTLVAASSDMTERWAGPAVVDALEREGLEFGRHKIFHRWHTKIQLPQEAGAHPQTPLFSVAHLREPGDLDPERLASLADEPLQGLVLFFAFPGVEDAIASFTDMLSTARRLATVLDGQLVDANGSDVSRQLAAHIRDELIQFQHKLKLSA